MSEIMRNKGRTDYKKMSSRGHSDSEDLLGAGSPALGKDAEKQTAAERIALAPGARSPGARYKYGLPKVEDDSYDLRTKKMQADWKELEGEEAELKKSQQLETMHRELEAKTKRKSKVLELK